MIHRSRAWLFAVILSCSPLAHAWAGTEPTVPVRVGNHPGFGRVVFDLPANLGYRLTRQGDQITIEFAESILVASSSAVPANVTAITGGAGKAELAVSPDAVVRDWRLGNRLVIDVSARAVTPTNAVSRPTARKTPPTAANAQTPPATMPAAPDAATVQPPASAPSPALLAPPAGPAAPATQQARPVIPPPDPPATVAETPAVPAPPAPAPSPTTPPAPAVQAASVHAEPPAETIEGSTLVVPFDAPIGLAAFRRGSAAFIVFDQRQAIDTAGLREDPIFGSATVQTLPNATIVRVILDPATTLSVARDPHAWRITAITGPPKLRPIQVLPLSGRLTFSAVAPGAVVSIVDTETGASLLVGTQRQAGQSIALRRRAVEFSILPTWQGVAIEPLSDNLTLRTTQDGFLLTAGTASLALSPSSDPVDLLAHAAGLTRRFEFPNLPIPALTQRLRQMVQQEAATPVLARGPRRRATAQAMIALGMGPEAQSMLQIAAADDPREAAAADNAALTSIAAILAHRPNDVGELGEQSLSATDDMALWSALHLAQVQKSSPQAATVLAATMPLLFTYPASLRDRVLPLTAETLITGGEISAAAALLAARKDDRTLAFARAMLKAGQGETDDALKIYDTIAQSRDQSDHARAAIAAVELRLASGRIDAAKAADALDKLLYAWRGDQRERALRERVAQLKARAGAWRYALTVLRDTEALFPADKVAIHAELTDMFSAMLREDAEAALAPLELAALAEENADLLPDGPAGEALEGQLADKLLALDLPKRAGQVLAKLMQAAPTPAGRAAFGARLAALRQREGDAAGALAALGDSAADDLPPDLVERRMILLADANARRGDADKALTALNSLNTAAADEARASILERGNDWPAAEKALIDYAAKTVPPEGKLDDGHRRTLLRLATAAARAGDEAALATLRQHDTARMETGPLADMFRLLTAGPVRNVADLKRSGQEAALARQLPMGLKALQAPTPPSP